jgi:hypothetical protein
MSIHIQLCAPLYATKQKLLDHKMDAFRFKLKVWEILERFRSKKGKSNKEEEEVRNRRKVKIQ